MESARPASQVTSVKPANMFDAYDVYGITSAQDMMRLQEEADAEARRAAARSSLAELSYSRAVTDASEALTGVMGDLAGTSDRRSLRAILTHQDRMRGLGFLLIALALAGLVTDYVMKP